MPDPRPPRPWYQRYKPSSSVQGALIAGAVTETLVGGVLLGVGTGWLVEQGWGSAMGLIAAGALVGMAKAWIALLPATRRNIERIRRRGDGRCIGGFLSWRDWLALLVMMLLGRGLRLAGLPMAVVGFIFVAVGTAVLISASIFWQAAGRD